jgi:hypothetical protein
VNAPAMDTRAAVMRTFRASSVDELGAHLAAGANRLLAMLAQIRPGEAAAAERCEDLAGQLDGLRLQALRLASALRRENGGAT